MKRLIILRGYPGAGKTTIGKALEETSEGTFVDHNAILTFIANIVGNDMGIYEDIHKLELALTKKLLNDGKSVIVARGFSRADSIIPYSEIAKSTEADLQVITLVSSTQELEKRVLAPERKNDFNPTTDSAALHEWVEKNQLEPFKSGIVVDADLPLDKVVNIVKKTLELAQ